MKIVRYKECWGLRLARFGRNLIEIWFCPPRFEIEEHMHPQERIELFFLFGKKTFFSRRDIVTNKVDSAVVSFPRNIFKRFTIMPYHAHYFKVSSTWLVFLNWERWRKGCKPTSAAEDFKLTNYYAKKNN